MCIGNRICLFFLLLHSLCCNDYCGKHTSQTPLGKGDSKAAICKKSKDTHIHTFILGRSGALCVSYAYSMRFKCKAKIFIMCCIDIVAPKVIFFLHYVCVSVDLGFSYTVISSFILAPSTSRAPDIFLSPFFVSPFCLDHLCVCVFVCWRRSSIIIFDGSDFAPGFFQPEFNHNHT